MRELSRPFVQVWDYMGRVGGFAGQAFLIACVIILILLFLTWLGNRK